MGRQVLVAVVCCLTLTQSSVFAENIKNSSVTAKDVKSEESVASRFYRNTYAPVAVYASSLPYGAYSFHSPIYASAPKAAGSNHVPVKASTVVYQNSNGYLKDSYGNKFVQSPQSIAYKTISPQQFVPIQDLPVHLSQPLVASGPSYHYKHSTPHFFNSQVRVPAQLASPTPLSYSGYSQPLIYAGDVRSISAPASTYNYHGPKNAQQQSTSNRVVYSNNSPTEQFNHLKNSPVFQRLVEQSVNFAHGNNPGASNPPARVQTAAQAQHTTIVTGPDGKKTFITLETQPSLPLLDLTLLQPLKFDNPIVPQVQHYLPKISGATYEKLPSININDQIKGHKEFIVKNTKSYDSEIIVGKPKVLAPKKEQKRPITPNEEDNSDEAPIQAKKPHREINEDVPVIAYEIKTPNGKEIYNEQKLSYNKATNSEPVHYSYGSHTKKEPVHYSYSHMSKKPVHNKEVYYESDGEAPPKHLIITIPNEEVIEKGEISHPQPINESNDSRESSAETQEEEEQTFVNEEQEHPRLIQQIPNKEEHPHSHYERDAEDDSPQHYSHHKTRPHFTSTDDGDETDDSGEKEENDERDYPPKNTHKSHKKHNLPLIVKSHNPLPQTNYQKPKQESHPVRTNAVTYDAPAHVYEKSKKIIIQQETPDEMHSHRELVKAQMIDQEENNEEDFEESFKKAAYGFPAYDQNRDKDDNTYDPDNFSVPPKEHHYPMDGARYEQYQEEGDEYPQSMRSNYKDSRDKVKDDYFTDYSIHRPEIMTDYYNDKTNYYKMYEKHLKEANIPKMKPRQTAKYTAAPLMSYNLAPAPKPKQYFVRYKATPQIAKHDISRPKATQDNSAFDSRPIRYRSKTNFVEPQFQYGFEPISIPHLLDSELAAMASNVSPESEKTGTRKKLYKENFYIKKTRTVGGKAAS